MPETQSPTSGAIYPLHAHTSYSILDGASPVSEYLDYCQKNGLSSCGCSDHGYVMGHYDLLSLSKEKGIKPIPGVEAYLHPGVDYVFRDKVGKDGVPILKKGETQKDEFAYFHLTLWARNMEGYRDLMMLSNASWDEGKVVARYGSLKPRVTWDELKLFGANLICGTGCAFGPVNYPLSRGETDMAERNLERLLDIFEGRLFVEVIPRPIRRDYMKSVITVKGVNGQRFLFHPDDIIETDQGDMTAREACKRQVTEIYSANPKRRQGSRITGRHHIRTIQL